MAEGDTMTGPRVAWVLWSGAVGGTEFMVASIAAEFRRTSHDARVLVLGDHRPLSSHLDRWAVPWVSLGLESTRRAFVGGSRILDVLESWGSEAVVLPTVDALARVIRASGYAGRLVAVDHGSPSDQRRLGMARAALRRISRRMGVGSLDVQVAVSDFVEHQIASLPHAGHIEAIHNGVDTGRFAPSTDSGRHDCLFRLGVASRLIEGKGVREALAVVERLHGSLTPVRLEVAGTGPLSDEIAAHPLHAEGVITAAGYVEDISEFWRRQDCALVLSNGLTESFGMAAAEAMACGLPVVASRAGGLTEIVVDGETGVLVTPGDIAGACSAIERYVADRSMARSMGQAARTRVVEQFSLERCAERYLRGMRSRVVSARIALVTDLISSTPDMGERVYARSLARELRARGCLVLSVDGESPEADEAVSCRRSLVSAGLRHSLRHHRPEVIVYLQRSSLTPAGLLRCGVLRLLSGSRVVPLVLQPYELAGPLRAVLARLVPRQIIAVSEGHATTLRQRCARCRVDAIPAAIDSARSRPASADERAALRHKLGVSPTRSLVLHVGHARANRNLAVLADIARAVDVQVVVVASSSTLPDPEIERALVDAGVRVVSGYVEAVEERYRATDVYVFPTRDESGSIGAPLSVLEALGCGVPVATSRFGALPELLGSTRGVVWVDSDEQFVPAVQRLVKSAPSAKALYSMDWAALASTVIDTVCEGHR